MTTEKIPPPPPLDVAQALAAICTYGHGRCWYCDVKLPSAERAIRAGWDVRRVEATRVASIILVCPKCARRKAKLGDEEFERRLTPATSSPSRPGSPRRGRIQPGMAGAPG